MWVKAHRGPVDVALSHETALVIYGVSDANPAAIHLTVPRNARLRRAAPDSVLIHRANLESEDITMVESLPVTTIARTVADLLAAGSRIEIVTQAISGARREGFISSAEAQRLRRSVQRHLRNLQKTS